MNPQTLPFLPLIFLLSFSTLLPFLQFQVYANSADEYLYKNCGSSFSCGPITGVDYPFRGDAEPDYCGYPGLVLNCRNNVATIDIMKVKYRVLNINQGKQTMKIAREDVMESTCPQNLTDTDLDNSLFEYASNYMSLTFLYGCPVYNFSSQIAACNISGYGSVYVIPGNPGPLTRACTDSVTVPVAGAAPSASPAALQSALREGFEVTWKVDGQACSDCTGSGGRCGYSLFSSKTTCYCSSEPYVATTCSPTAGGYPSASTQSPGMLLQSPTINILLIQSLKRI